ncbi:MAG: amidase [Alphaproteobacteria bacterium]|nr:amidase [Alphaproteobacteria bacterium]
MPDLELCYLPASQAARLFRERKLSPVELMEAVIARAEAVDGGIKAFTYTHFDEAMVLARKAEAKFMKAGARVRPLEGLAIGIKDESYIKGKPTSTGSLIYKDYVADHTSPVNERILRAGGIVHARTATPEFCCAGYTNSRLWGVTSNPWNREFTPGGSSGGSSASLAAGTSAIATGSDIGGSIRIPASTCGLVGYKPPYGRNPDDPPFNLDFYCHTGPLARTVADAILLQNVISGPHPADISTLRPKLRLPQEYKPIKGWKVAYSMDLGSYEVDRGVARNTHAALDVFRSLGATVAEVDLGWNADVQKAALTYLEHLFGAWIAKILDEHADEMTTYARAFAEKGRNSKSTDFIWSLEVAGDMYRSFGPMMEKHDIFICPTTALPAVPADFDQSRDEIRINGRTVDPMLGWVMTAPFNTLSRCPVITVPSGRASNGVPTGIQIVGRTYRDADVFRAAMAYETAAGPWFADVAGRPKL